jgi:hypothetical protein
LCRAKALNPGENHPGWKGGRTTHRGYVLLKRPDHPFATKRGYVYEHRLVMEEKLGRILSPSEIVHHKDGVKDHNDPDNLFLFDSNSEHLVDEYKNKNETFRVTIKCARCGKTFMRLKTKVKPGIQYCFEICRTPGLIKSTSTKIEGICAWCGNKFMRVAGKIRHGESCCSKSCALKLRYSSKE